LPIFSGLTMPPFSRRPIGLTVRQPAYIAGIVPPVSSRCVQDGRAHRSRSACRAQIVAVMLPQAIVRMLPAFGSLLSITIKDTAIASVIAVPVVVNRKRWPGRAFSRSRYTPSRCSSALILFPVTRGVDLFYRRVAPGGHEL
jgi:polar amino acid transport system permease protein